MIDQELIGVVLRRLSEGNQFAADFAYAMQQERGLRLEDGETVDNLREFVERGFPDKVDDIEFLGAIVWDDIIKDAEQAKSN